MLSGQGGPERALTAMRSAHQMLVDDELQIIKLFTPPFDKTEHDPGYVKSYPPGVRENGGQYTHGAIWFVIALAELGLADEAWRCFRMLNPVNHALDRGAADCYRVEPYVVAADIYSVGPLAGRGGWTWYTGSAGWLYRAAVEAILGIRKHGNTISVKPVLPPEWNGFAATLRLGGAHLPDRGRARAGPRPAGRWRSTARQLDAARSSFPTAAASVTGQAAAVAMTTVRRHAARSGRRRYARSGGRPSGSPLTRRVSSHSDLRQPPQFCRTNAIFALNSVG